MGCQAAARHLAIVAAYRGRGASFMMNSSYFELAWAHGAQWPAPPHHDPGPLRYQFPGEPSLDQMPRPYHRSNRNLISSRRRASLALAVDDADVSEAVINVLSARRLWQKRSRHRLPFLGTTV